LEEVGRVADINFTLTADDDVDDLPRTLRREREAREREQREREDKARKATLTHDFGASDAPREMPAYAAAPATVVRFDVPFTHLMGFFLKAVLAAVPALILLGTLLWFAGALLKALYPELIHTEVLIRIPR
jgi:hypothetical protein